jgi:hypothetical protein
MQSSVKSYPEVTKIRLNNVRLAFPVLNEPEQFQGTGKARYSATVVWPAADAATTDAVQAAGLAALTAVVGAVKAKALHTTLLANLKTPYNSGDKKATYDGFDGGYFLSAHSQSEPTLYDNVAGPDGKPSLLKRPQNRLYAGCYVNAVVSLYYQSKWGRLCCSVSGVQFAGDGDAFSGSAPAASDEFEAAAPAEGMDDLG